MHFVLIDDLHMWFRLKRLSFPGSESETFELFCPARLDELLKEAYTLENNMKQQKEKLKGRLKQLSKTLDMMEASASP